mgnify:CR=1 FL=1
MAKANDIDISIWKISDKYSPESLDSLCAWPFQRILISSDMKAVPCCMIGNPDIATLGDGNDIEKTWGSEVYQGFRRNHIQGKIPKFCENCYK